MIFLITCIVSLLVIIAVICILFYKQYEMKTTLDMQLQDIVGQINNASLYAFNYDKTQNDNIMNVDVNLTSLSDTIKDLSNNVKAIEIKTSDIDDIRNSMNKAKSYIEVGKHVLSSKDEQWMNIQPNVDNMSKSVGLSTDKLFVNTSSVFKNFTEADNIIVNSSFETKGGNSIENSLHLKTYLPYSDGINYIRGDTEITGDTKVIGDVSINKGKKLCIGTTCITEQQLRNLTSVIN